MYGEHTIRFCEEALALSLNPVASLIKKLKLRKKRTLHSHEFPGVVMDFRVRNLYKRLILLARDYPRGFSEARIKLQNAFRSSQAPLDEALAKGKSVARELETLIYLHKYRALFKRYEELTPKEPPSGTTTPAPPDKPLR